MIIYLILNQKLNMMNQYLKNKFYFNLINLIIKFIKFMKKLNKKILNIKQ